MDVPAWTRLPVARHDNAQPGAFITNGNALYEITEATDDAIAVENSKTGSRLRIPHTSLITYRLARAAPTVPDTPELVYSD